MESERLDTPKLEHAIVTAHAWEGFTITTEDGRPATLAVVDENGRVVESGPRLVAEVWAVAVLAYRRLLKRENALTVWSAPSGLFQEREKR